MTDMIKDVVELNNGLKLELFRYPDDKADFPWGIHGELIEDMSKILEIDTSAQLYNRAQLVTAEGIEVPLFPSPRDKETKAELQSPYIKGYMVKIDKEKAKIQKNSVAWHYGDEIIARSVLEIKEKSQGVEVHEVELNDYYRWRRAFDNTYLNGQRQGKEIEYNVSGTNKRKIREADWKNNQKDGEEIFYDGSYKDKLIWENGVRKQQIKFNRDATVYRTKEFGETANNGFTRTVTKTYRDGALETEFLQDEDLTSEDKGWDVEYTHPIEEWSYDKEGKLISGYKYEQKSNEEFKGCLDSWYKKIKLSEKDVRFVRKELELKESLAEAEKIAAHSKAPLKAVLNARRKGKNITMGEVMALKHSQKLDRK